MTHQLRFLLLFVVLAVFTASNLSAQRADAFRIFNQKGKRVSYGKLFKAAEKADVVFFGELHNDPIAHYLQLKLAKHLIAHSDKQLVIGAEMLESDNQQVINRYLADELDYAGLDSTARLWPNYSTDYRPVVDVAKANTLPVIATNIPRKYASMVFRGGFESLEDLPASEQQWIAPLPIAYDPELPSYKAMLEMAGMHGGDNLPKAQAIKDATMAHFIHTNLSEKQKMLHLNGSYHSDRFEGIVWYLKRLNPELKILTISTVLVDKPKNPTAFKTKGLADFIIAVDEDMTRTY